MHWHTPRPGLRPTLEPAAEIVEGPAVELRVWAPNASHVEVVMDGRPTGLEADRDGWFGGVVHGRAGSRYGFRLDHGPRVYPDPASRFQPDGPHGLSEVIDPSEYRWHDDDWRGRPLPGQVLYELHVGTFTPEGTWAAAARELERLGALGITTVQMMPVAEFAGAFGWGYDGVNWGAPSHLYGRPDDFRRFVDLAHCSGIGVVLDVVYNHLGPDGNFLATYARDYFTDRYQNEWGEALNFDGPGAAAVRTLVLTSVERWVREYHVDGFRLDATQQIFDRSPEHIIGALVSRAREAAGRRALVVIGENEPQQARLMRPRSHGGEGLDGLYNDDFHHSTRVALTGLREAYYSDYTGTSREWLAAVRHGFLFQGQRYSWQDKARGSPVLDRPGWQFIHFLENHDQVANSAAGRRLSELAAPGQLRALTALLLLAPATPLLFQGQEYGSTAPFVYFAHHADGLAANVRQGRQEFLGQFSRFRTAAVMSRQRDPATRDTFDACKLARDNSERAERFLRLHQDLLTIRRDDEVIARLGEPGLDGATLDDRCLLLRFAGNGAGDRLLAINLGCDIDVAARSEPLLAPPHGASWRLLWSSEDPAYGGSGTPEWTERCWRLPGHAALLLTAPAISEDAHEPHGGR